MHCFAKGIKEEDITAEITDHDLDLLKVIGKGTFVKVGPFLACESLRHIITLHACVLKAWVRMMPQGVDAQGLV